MCGIAGIFAFTEEGRSQALHLQNSIDRLIHRGPNSGGIFSSDSVHLGHRRLSIIDLSNEANQPMHDSSKRYVIVFNGEIYNFKQIRDHLLRKGVEFETSSDTEVLLYAYIHYGKKCLELLHGFFAFIIYDRLEHSLFAARDRMGIKPLLYHMDEDRIIFSSEMSSLLEFGMKKNVDPTSLFQFLQLTYVPSPHAIFEGFRKLPQGHYLSIEGKSVEISAYYDIRKVSKVRAPLTYEEAKKELRLLIAQSVEERMISDVPLGAFLSGGIDSSAIVAFAATQTEQLQTFSIGYKDEPFFDETRYAEMVAKKYNTQHTAFMLTADDFYEHLFDMLDNYGEPFADASALAVNILCKETRKKVTVALSGDGADELFAGYNKHWGEWRLRQGGTLPALIQIIYPLLTLLPNSRNSNFSNKLRQIVRFGKMMSLNPQERYWFLCSWRDELEAKSILSPSFLAEVDLSEYDSRKRELTASVTGLGINDMLLADTQGLLVSDMLHKVDSMSMLNGLEVRVPFMDHRVVEFATRLPSEYKIRGSIKKRILQDSVRDMLPPELYNRPKHGFDVPLMNGYKTALRPWVEDMLDKDFVAHQGIFDIHYTEKLKKIIFQSNDYDQNQIWSILTLQHWWKKYKPLLSLKT